FVRDGGQLQPAIRRAAEVLRRQIQPRAVRTERLDRQREGAVREVHHGLYFPVDGREVPGRGGRADERGGRDSGAARDGARSAAGAAIPGGGDGCSDVRGVRRADDAQWVVL